MNIVQTSAATPTVPSSPTSSRREQADDTRERLLAAAWELVRTRGVAELSIRKLAMRAHVSVGLPHAHFGSRGGLLDALRIRAWDEIDGVIEATVGPPSAVPDDYEAHARRALNAVVDHSLTEPRLFELVALTPGVVMSDAVFQREAASAQKFLAFLLDGERAGAFRFHGDAVVFALSLWTSVQGFILRSSATTTPILQQVQAKVLDEILEAFFARVRVARAAV